MTFIFRYVTLLLYCLALQAVEAAEPKDAAKIVPPPIRNSVYVVKFDQLLAKINLPGWESSEVKPIVTADADTNAMLKEFGCDTSFTSC